MSDELVNLLSLPVSSLCCVCRLCAAVIDASSAVSIFYVAGNTEGLAGKINKYLPIAVDESDPFPKTVCKQCADQLNKFHELVQKCVLFEEHLHKTLETSPVDEIDANAELDVELEGLKNSPEVEFDIQEFDYLESGLLNDRTEKPFDGTGAAGAPCQICRERLPNFAKCLQHQKTHINDGMCVICDFKSESEVEINLHLRKHFGDTSPPLGKRFKREKEQPCIKACLKCDKVFDSVDTAVEHCKAHRPTDISSHTCVLCLTSVNSAALLSHIADHFRPLTTPLSCQACQKEYPDEKTIKYHRCAVLRKYKCTKCKMGFKSESRLKFHEDFHTTKQTFCELCRKDFKFESRIYLHLTGVHQGERDNPFSCDTCGKTFRYINALRTHQRTHSDDRPFGCGKCDARFHSKSSLTVHQLSHDDTARLHCLRCEYSTSRKQNLLKHVARLHKQVDRSQVVARCRECSEVFPNATHAEVESHKHGGYSDSASSSLEALIVTKLYQCERCHRSFVTAEDLTAHRSQHSSQGSSAFYSCRLCDAGFNKHDFLVRHQKTVHQGIFSLYTGKLSVLIVILCDICGLEWVDYTQLLNHKERGNCLAKKVRGEVRTNKVPSVPRLLPIKASQLNINAEGLFECLTCLRTYKSRRRYRLHLATHGEKKLIEELDQ